MKKTIDQVEDVNITLDTVLGLARTINDLLEENILMFVEYPSNNASVKFRANRLADKLLVLASAMIAATETAQNQINTAVNSFYKDGEK
ncbi:hypothetical protein DKZ23_10190 [Limosilactobacillus reuteri]|uniref:Uncharacterized protein n=1 Tax=Limosilactobacillus reuteri TaxID=1598 RepID=A0A317GDU1_LIMRT|nr:hypothetical protein [Limosilactobacillus reuteri]MCH5384988.1 hypothetical protein [Limosilactobacillus reuteri]PWT44906.1 hypothetical protein DKZ23_10190 [Limosilactobacillus reuteri]PWT49606.1 hypothetical protein DKZ33_08420 [Limosilactobacillus reuteri]PWT61582.1 hypothetical protein DKZ32_07620 [Limosilactobacillus reuteri]